MRNNLDLPSLARQLAPFLKPMLSGVSSGTTTTGGAPSPHGLNSVHHSGTLITSQYPDALLRSGTRTLIGNLAVSSGVTIDGVDISAHAADPAAHHSPVTVNGGLILSGQQLTVGVGNGLTLSGTDVLVDLATNSGLTFSSGNLALGTPGTNSVSSTNAVSTSTHTHQITSSSNPGAAASLLASNASGYLQLVRLGAGVSPAYPLHARLTTEQLRLEYDASNYASFVVGAGGNLTVAPSGDFVFDPTGNDILPQTGYDLNIGSLQKKYLTLHAAELWVETLVAQDTIATIGGRILVGPTTSLEEDFGSSQTTSCMLKHNQVSRLDTLYMEANGKVEFIRCLGAAIVAASPTNEQFQIAGDWTAIFTNGVKFTIDGSTANDGEWTVVSSVYSSPNTTITVSEDVTSGTADGHIIYTGEQGVGPYRYLTISRNLDGSGANDWYAGDAVFNTGQAGGGFIDIYSIGGVASGSGPAIVGDVRNSQTYNDWSEHWALGNLNGVYGYGADTYGVGLGPYGTGSENYLTIDATNGVRFFTGSSVEAQLTGSTWTLGSVSGGEYVKITSSGVELYGNAIKNVDVQSNGDIYLGNQAASYLFYDASGHSLTFYNSGGSSYMDFDGANDLADFGLPRAARVSDQGVEVASVSGYGRFRVSSSLGEGGSFGQIYGSLASSGQYHGYYVMPARSSAGDSSYLNSLHLVAYGLTGSPSSLDVEFQLYSQADGTEYFKWLIDSTTYMTLDDTGNLILNQQGNDGEILSLKSSDVAHGVTTVTETNTYGFVRKSSGTDGGLLIYGFCDTGAEGIRLRGVSITTDTARSTAAEGAVIVDGVVKSGTNVAAFGAGADANVLVVRDGPSARMVVASDGDIHLDATSNNNVWDVYDDVALLVGVREAMGARLSEFVEESRPILERTGVVTYNPDGHHFIAMKALHGLEIDAMRQLYQENQRLTERVTLLEKQLL